MREHQALGYNLIKWSQMKDGTKLVVKKGGDISKVKICISSFSFAYEKNAKCEVYVVQLQYVMCLQLTDCVTVAQIHFSLVKLQNKHHLL